MDSSLPDVSLAVDTAQAALLARAVRPECDPWAVNVQGLLRATPERPAEVLSWRGSVSDRARLRKLRDEGDVNAGVPEWALDKFPWAPMKARREFDPRNAGLAIIAVIRGFCGGTRFLGRDSDDFGNVGSEGGP